MTGLSEGASPVLAASSRFRAFCYVLAWVGGFNIMLLEMCAFRAMQTRFGSSILVTGVLLSLVMIALAGGYYLGGVLSRRRPGLQTLFVLLLGCIGYVHLFNLTLSTFVFDQAFELWLSLRPRIPALAHTLPPGLAALVLYALPMIAMSQISPFLMQHLTAAAPEQGESRERAVGLMAGKLLAISTVGSFMGTLLPSHVLIPELGLRVTLLILEGSLALVVIIGWVLVRGSRVVPAVAVLVLAVMPFVPPPPARAPNMLVDRQSAYGHIRVYDERNTQGQPFLHYKVSEVYTHSFIYRQDPLLWSSGIGAFVAGQALGARRYLVLGTALGGVTAAIVASDPSAHVTGVDVDSEVIELSQQLLPGLAGAQVSLVADDARLFLEQTAETYDYIVIDLFAGSYIPSHCISREFFQLVASRLRPGGSVWMNSNMAEYRFPARHGVQLPSPLDHLYSALREAGFTTLFHSNYYGIGSIYAFPQPMPEEVLRARLAAIADAPQQPLGVRAGAALTALGLVPVPEERMKARPFTDDWTPEYLIQKGTEMEPTLARALSERLAPVPEGQPVPPASVSAISARLFADWWRSGTSLRLYSKGPAGPRYCRQLLAWADATTEPVARVLAHDAVPVVFRSCADALEPPTAGESPRARAVRSLMRALVLMGQDNAQAAFPLLMEARQLEIL